MIITNQVLNAVVCHLFEIPGNRLVVVLAMQNNEPALPFHHFGIHSTGIEKIKHIVSNKSDSCKLVASIFGRNSVWGGRRFLYTLTRKFSLTLSQTFTVI